MRRWAISFLLVGLAAAEASAANVRLLSHRAGYDLKLVTSDSGSGIAALEGKLLTEWSEACEGFVTTQEMVTVLRDVNGNEVLNEINVTSWESRDGGNFRFSTRHDINRKNFETVRGKAVMADGAITVEFQEPKSASFDLPKATLFPTQLMVAVMADALEGKRTSGYQLFDGGRMDSFYDVFVVFGARREPRADAPPLVAKLYSWPVTLAYFPSKPREGQPEGTPEQEIQFNLYSNGVADNFNLNFQDYAIRGELSDLEALPASTC